MNKNLLKTVLIGVAITVLSAALAAQPYPGPRFTSFFDSTSTFNGQLVPVGSIIRAYDPDGVLCGIDTFGVNPTAAAGHFGYMPVYGDDPTTTGLDEGAIGGDTIHFTINDRPATFVTGDRAWVDQTQKRVNLSATGSLAVTLVVPPADTLVTVNRTIKARVGVRNDGDGIDYFRVAATNGNVDFSTVAEDSFVYANPAETVYVTFDIQTPMFASDTVDLVSYTVYSQIDSTVKTTGSMTLTMSITDVNDGRHGNLPGGFALFQNYPNPFNPSTTISYSLPSRSAVKMDVIDALGRTVDSRELGEQSAGVHDLQYDGSGLASGVYFYRITSSTGSQAKKMVLLK